MELPAIRRLLAQHAHTSRLMGVDFVPLGRAAGAVSLGETPDIETARVEYPLGAREPWPMPAPISGDVRPSRSQASAAKPAPSAFEEPSLIAGASTGVAQPMWELKPVPRERGAIERALADLLARYEKDAPHKNFVTDHHKIVFHDGDPCARLMFIGEAPGADEDRTGIPFVGRAGQLLNKMIAAMGLRREQVYIANVLKTRPPDNATPTSDEIRLCAPYLYDQVRIVRPEVIVTLGLPATRAMLATTDSMSRLRGRWASFTPPGPDSTPIPVMPTYHPAFLLRSYTEENRGKVWSDLRLVMGRLGLAPVASEQGGTGHS
jgi:DNA polymerase